MGWTPNALRVLEKRYLLKGSDGQTVETPEGLLERVATAISAVEDSTRAEKKWRQQFLELMSSGRFLPNSPTLMNAGKKQGQLSACFVLPIEDSLDGIFDTLKNAAMIHQSGGGTGFSFSRLRPQGAIVNSTRGVASGPVSFIRIFDVATETIKQGGTRRGANMAILRADHPDVLEFIRAKRDQRSLTNFNVSVAIPDTFMHRLLSNQGMDSQGQNSKIFDEIVDSAWECGDPGLIFLDRINRFNPTPQVGEMESTNPCGEQPLLPYESCNLGSLNLGMYWRDASIQWELLRADIHTAVRFLDNVVDANDYPIPATRKITLRNRKIGLGVMGFADLLLFAGISYDSDAAAEVGERLMSFIDREAKQASMNLARERGAFPNFAQSMWKHLGYPKLRNATVTTVAPTGTISILAGCSSGIEPIFSAALTRNVLDGERLVEVHPPLEKHLGSQGYSIEKMGVSDAALQKKLGPSWMPAHSVSVTGHLRVQAAFQRHSDSGVSKTINLPNQATREDVRRAYLEAFQRGCKGITVFRDGSRGSQVLERAQEPTPSVPPRTFVCETC